MANNIKIKQIESSALVDGYIIVDISTRSIQDSYMKCDYDDFIRWASDRRCGRIHAIQDPRSSTPYASFKFNGIARKNVLFHRFVDAGFDSIDHINRDGIDNRKVNLRDGSCSVNQINQKTPKTNKSGYKGICWHRVAKKWWARISISGNQISLGLFDDIHEAVCARRVAEKKYFGSVI